MAHLRLISLLAASAAVCSLAFGASAPGAAAASCPNTSLTPTPANVEQVRTAVLCLIDQEREHHGEVALTVNGKLTRAAQRHSREMAEEDYFAHNSPAGQTPLDRMRAAGYIASAQDGYVVGENIAWGTLWLATPQSIVHAWMESPGHRANILDGAYRETGVGVEPRPPASLAEGQQGALYTQDFGAVVPPGHSSRRSPSAVSVGGERTIGQATHHHRRRRSRHHRGHRRHHRRRHRHRRHRRHRRHAHGHSSPRRP
ncbi:MAG TPA: CAP domain-containing protein [Solirubrobacteraceae bacterium]|nr:CAP domain-containing protein [Solirubrobacteraceae bacterium]